MRVHLAPSHAVHMLTWTPYLYKLTLQEHVILGSHFIVLTIHYCHCYIPRCDIIIPTLFSSEPQRFVAIGEGHPLPQEFDGMNLLFLLSFSFFLVILLVLQNLQYICNSDHVVGAKMRVDKSSSTMMLSQPWGGSHLVHPSISMTVRTSFP